METRITFTITGSALTRIARGFMTDDWPEKALTFLLEGLPGIDVVTAHAVLEGTQRLAGDSVQGVTAEPDSAPEHAEHVRFLYAGRVRVRGRWWRPRAVVVSFCGRDTPRGVEAPHNLPGNEAACAAWHARRVGFYARSGEVVLRTKREGHRAFVIFAPCGAPPSWHRQELDPTRALDEFEAAGRTLEQIDGSLVDD